MKVKHLIIIVLIILFLIFRPYLGKKFVNDKIDTTSEWYVNDIYMSDQYYYNNILTSEEQIIYRTLMDGFVNIEQEIIIPSCDVFKIVDAIQMDHPEIINLTTYAYINSGSSMTIKPKYITDSEKKLKRMIAEVQTVVTKIEKETRYMSDYEKELYIYTYLGENSRYRKQDLSNQSAYTGLIKGENTVCAGYGKAAQILFQNVGIDSYILLGEQHLFNLVKIEEEYYYFDATHTYVPNRYNTIAYTGLNMQLSQMTGGMYKILYPATLPKANGTQYNYFLKEGYYIENVNEISKIGEFISKQDSDSQFVEFLLIGITQNEFSSAINGYTSELEELGYKNKYGYLGNIVRLYKD